VSAKQDAQSRTAPKLRKALKAKSPGLAVERQLWAEGHQHVVGVDEVGRGSWAGPISVGAAVVPSDRRLYKIRDSKMLTEREREAMFDRIAEWCVTWAVGHATQVECDELGMSAAQKLAARRAIEQLSVVPTEVGRRRIVIIEWMRKRNLGPQPPKASSTEPRTKR